MLVRDLKRELSDVFADAERQGAGAAPLPNFGEPAVVPVDKPLSELTIGLLVSLGARTGDQTPLRSTNDLKFNLIDRNVPTAAITFDHPSPIRYWADRDINVAFPRDRLQELEASGVIGALSPAAVSILGSITLWDEIATALAPRVKAEFDSQGVDLVLMVPFCPACHRAMMILARAMERRGMPTLTLSTLADISEAFKPPRTALLNYPPGAPCGRPNDVDHQRNTLTGALRIPLASTARRIAQVPLSFQPDGGDDWVSTTFQLYRKGAQIVRDDAVAHGKPAWLAGQEEQFTIRCDC